MKSIDLLAIGRTVGARRPVRAGTDPEVSPALLEDVARALSRTFHASCYVRSELLAADFAFDPVRNQYHATAILQRMATLLPARDDEETRLLGVTALDLYVPVLTFVFGEAQLEGRCALVSLHRLREEFYGLPVSNDRLHERLTKEAAHELGHTFGLRHCPDWRCVMASAHGVERLDLKTADFCPACRQFIALAAPLLAGGR